MKLWRLWLAGLVLAVCAADADAGGRRRGVKIGMLRSMFRNVPSGMVRGLSRPFRRMVEAQTGVPGAVEVLPDAATLAQQIQAGDVQLGVFHGYEYAWLRQKHPELKPLVVVVPPVTKLKAYIVTNKDGAVRQVGHLNGKTVAVSADARPESKLYLKRAVADQPVKFAKVTNPRYTEDAIDEVIDGNADAAVVDGGSLIRFSRFKPGRFKRLRIVGKSEEFPYSVIAYRENAVTPATLTRFRRGLTSAHRTTTGKSLLSLWRLRGFAPVPATYDRNLSTILKAYPPPAELISSGR